MANATANNIVDCVTSGIKKATVEHLNLVNYYQDLSWGPEYFLTVNIVNELKKLTAAYIFLEEVMSESRGPSRGRRPAGYSPNNRYDIVVRTSNGSPMAAIEVKHRVYSVGNRIEKDIQRLSSAVRINSNGKTVFKMGIFAFYTVFEKGGSRAKDPKEAINNLYDKLEERFDDLRGDAILTTNLISPKGYKQLPELVWGGGCFVLTPP